MLFKPANSNIGTFPITLYKWDQIAVYSLALTLNSALSSFYRNSQEIVAQYFCLKQLLNTKEIGWMSHVCWANRSFYTHFVLFLYIWLNLVLQLNVFVYNIFVRARDNSLIESKIFLFCHFFFFYFL